jgi:hypothetical protein
VRPRGEKAWQRIPLTDCVKVLVGGRLISSKDGRGEHRLDGCHSSSLRKKRLVTINEAVHVLLFDS